MESTRRRSPTVVAALVAGTLVGGTLLGSAGAHTTTPGHLWKKHIKPKADNRYVNERNFSVSIPWWDFTPRNSADPFAMSDFRGISGSTGTHAVLAPVLLPHKATITKVTCHFYDASTAVEVGCVMRRAPFDAEVVESVGGLMSSSGSGGFISDSDSTPLNNIVNNNKHFYYVQVEPSGGDWQGLDTTIKGAVIKYTVD